MITCSSYNCNNETIHYYLVTSKNNNSKFIEAFCFKCNLIVEKIITDELKDIAVIKITKKQGENYFNKMKVLL